MSQPTVEEGRSACSPAGRTTDTVAPAPGKPYVRPTLERYGKLVDLTGFGGSQLVDSGVGSLQNP